MLDLKAFRTANIILLVGICVSLFLLIPVQMKQSVGKKNAGKTQYLDCIIHEMNHTVTNDEAKVWLMELRKLRQSNKDTFIQIQMDEGQCVVPDELFASTDKFSYTLLESLTYYLHESELYFALEGDSALTEEYTQLQTICSKYGIGVERVEHDGTRQSSVKTVKGQLNRFLGIISAGCSFIILFVLELFYFQKRKKAWRIRRIFGVSVGSLLKETVITQCVLFVSSAVITLFILKGWYHFGMLAMMKSTLFILIEYFIIILFWILVLLYQTSPLSHHLI